MRWWTPRFHSLGIVAVETGFSGEWKAYIGTGLGNDERVDARLIADWGAGLDVHEACVFFPYLDKEKYKKEERDMSTEEQTFLEQKIEALQHTERRSQIRDNPYMTMDAAYALGEQIERERPDFKVEVVEAVAPYTGSYFVKVTDRFQLVIRNPKQWEERKKDIRKVE